MSVLEIKTFEDRSLTKSAKSIRKVTDELRQLAVDMAETMVAARGVGLAANQVGVLKRLIVVLIDDDIVPFVNPRIVKKSKEKESESEGCLSFPRLYGTVPRHYSVRVVAYDLDMNPLKIEAEGMTARIFQHEIDHLNGVTFNTRAEKGTLREVKPQETIEETAEGGTEPAAEPSAGGAETE